MTGTSGRGDPADLYAILGVAPDAPQEEIVHAYRRRAHRVHPDTQPPDTGQAAAGFRALTDAYQVLRDPARRAAYDRQRTRQRPPGPGVAHRSEQQPPPPRPPAGHRPGPPPGTLIWAGPVRVEPPGGRGVPAGSALSSWERLMLAWLLGRHEGGW